MMKENINFMSELRADVKRRKAQELFLELNELSFDFSYHMRLLVDDHRSLDQVWLDHPHWIYSELYWSIEDKVFDTNTELYDGKKGEERML